MHLNNLQLEVHPPGHRKHQRATSRQGQKACRQPKRSLKNSRKAGQTESRLDCTGSGSSTKILGKKKRAAELGWEVGPGRKLHLSKFEHPKCEFCSLQGRLSEALVQNSASQTKIGAEPRKNRPLHEAGEGSTTCFFQKIRVEASKDKLSSKGSKVGKKSPVGDLKGAVLGWADEGQDWLERLGCFKGGCIL